MICLALFLSLSLSNDLPRSLSLSLSLYVCVGINAFMYLHGYANIPKMPQNLGTRRPGR